MKKFCNSRQNIIILIYKQNIKSNNEYYIDNIFNSINDLKIKVFDVNDYMCWGTPGDLTDYENKILG